MNNILSGPVAVIGAGNIGGAMARGLARAGATVHLYNRSAGRLDAFAGVAGVEIRTTDIGEALRGASMVVVCVEGHALAAVMRQVASRYSGPRPVIVSCAAAGTLEELGAMLQPFITDAAIVRVLPNIAAAYGASTNLVCARGMAEDELDRLCRLFDSVGPCFRVDERLFPAAMAISSCGIANVLRYVRAATEAGVELGLSPDLACRLASGSLAGTAAMLDATGAHPEALVDKVTTPGGLTIRGINAMEAGGFSAAVIAGVKAAAKS